jgi:Domain of unknown function (DUF4397)
MEVSMQYRLTSLALCMVGLALLACDDDDDPPTEPPQTRSIRVVNASTGTTGTVDVFAGTQSIHTGLALRGSACINVPVGAQTISFRQGATTLATAPAFTFSQGSGATAVLFGAGTTRSAAVFSDVVTDPSANNMALRFINASGAAGDVHVTTPTGTLGTASPANLAVNTASSFSTFPTANTRVRLFNVGTTAGNPRADLTVSGLPTNRVSTVVFVDAGTPAGAPAFQANPCP